MAKATPSAKRPAAEKSPPVAMVAPRRNGADDQALRRAPGKKAPGKKAAAKKVPAKKVPAEKAPAKKVPAKKAPAKKAPAKKAPASSPFSVKWLAQQEATLIDERATYVRQADTLQAEADALVADFESGDSQFDEDGGEGDSLSSERERDLALSAQARAAVEEIDHALAKFATGTYGICEASGEPIPIERLEAIPWARVQVRYKTGGIGRP